MIQVTKWSEWIACGAGDYFTVLFNGSLCTTIKIESRPQICRALEAPEKDG